MQVLICPDSFKGTLSAKRAAECMALGVVAVIPRADVACLPLADGGEGTLDAMLSRGGRRLEREVTGPSGKPVSAAWGILPDGTGVVEMASASGLTHVDVTTNDLLSASTFGTGELIRAAVNEGCRNLVIGIGGSATNDGGTGAVSALGVRFLDVKGEVLPPGGGPLSRLSRIDLSRFRLPAELKVTIASDVRNPLCGPEGATRVFGPQKGGSEEDLDLLEAGLSVYADVLAKTFGWNVAEAPGAGAAGGLGAALLGFLHGRFAPGIDVVMDHVDFDAAARSADVILTGEGSLDATSLMGKTLSGVLRRAGNTPVIAVCGRVLLDAEAQRDSGFHACYASGLDPDPETALVAATARALREFRNGRSWKVSLG